MHSELFLADSCGMKSFLKNYANQPLFGEKIKPCILFVLKIGQSIFLQLKSDFKY